MTDYFNCPGCGFELPGTPELTEDCFFCGWVFPAAPVSAVPVPTGGKKAGVIPVTGDMSNHNDGYQKARLIILDWHTGESYRKMAKRLGVKKKKIASVAAALCNVANGNNGQPAVLVLLGLEPETAPAPVCINPACDGYGQPHTFDCQTQSIIEKTAESKRYNNRKPRPRLSIHRQIADSAGMSIVNLCDTDYIRELRDYLDEFLSIVDDTR